MAKIFSSREIQKILKANGFEYVSTKGGIFINTEETMKLLL